MEPKVVARQKQMMARGKKKVRKKNVEKRKF